MSELRDLYQAVILDHNKKPRNFGELPEHDRSAEGYNPLCGDQIVVQLAMHDDTIDSIGFVGHGCAISTASASLMTEAVRGKSVEEAERLFDDFHELVTAPTDAPTEASHLGKLAVFAGVREFPMRVKCATLCWHTMLSALKGGGKQVTTE